MGFHRIYEHSAGEYDQLVEREDYLANLNSLVRQLLGSKTLKILEMGAGTGRVSRILHHLGHQVYAYDLHFPMLRTFYNRNRQNKVRIFQADHRHLPLQNNIFDAMVAGWTLCHLVDDSPDHWRSQLDGILKRLESILKPGAPLMIIDTLGTGNGLPEAPAHLEPYYDYLEDKHGFKRHWTRTDYRFVDEEEARSLSSFFFGTGMKTRLKGNILPECTGVWFRLNSN